MIRVQRPHDAPEVLSRRFTDGRTEQQRNEDAVDELIAAAGLTPAACRADILRALEEFQPTTTRYKEIKTSLGEVFHRKCAYCESIYATTQPPDVEHFRPKAEVKDSAGRVLRPGYYWLAADWSNLLPTCIDCNRPRYHTDDRTHLLGKGTHFPLRNELARIRWHAEGRVDVERPLLLDPCSDDPDEHLQFRSDGTVTGTTERGVASIEIYGLMRDDLVRSRRERAVVLDMRLDQLLKLSELQRSLADRTFTAADDETLVEELIYSTGREIDDMVRDAAPYAGMARQLLRRARDAA